MRISADGGAFHGNQFSAFGFRVSWCRPWGAAPNHANFLEKSLIKNSIGEICICTWGTVKKLLEQCLEE
jgi:hypothetical protein